MWAAAAVPAATASVGDRRGIMLGETCTATRRPVAWDPWLAQEVRRASGLTAVVGGLGSGKSFLTGLIVYKSLRAGARWTVLDPSGPLAELTRLPELAPFSRHINLLRAEPGILNPYRVVAEPRAEHFADEDEPERAWRRERSLAAATRRRLVLDVLTGLLPYDVARIPHTRIVLLRAVREVGGAADRHPGQVIDTLRRHARDGEDHAGHRRRLPRRAPRAAAGRAAVPRHVPRRPVAGRPRVPAHGADDAGHDAAAAGQPARRVDRRRVTGRRAAQPGVVADPAHDLRREPEPAQGRRAGRDALPVAGADRQGAHRPAGPRLAQVQRPGAVRLAARRRPAAGVRVRLAGQRRVRRAHGRRGGAGRGAAAAARADRGRLRADARHAVAAAPARRPAGRHAAPVRLRRRARRRREDPDRPRGAAPGPRAGGARHEPGREPGRRAAGSRAAEPGRRCGRRTSRPRRCRDARRLHGGRPPGGARAQRCGAARRRAGGPARSCSTTRSSTSSTTSTRSRRGSATRPRGTGRGGTGPAGSGRVPRVGTGYPAGPFGDAPGTAGGCAGAAGDARAGGCGAHRGPAARRARAAGPPRGRRRPEVVRRRGVALLVVTGLVGGVGAARHAGVRAEPGLQGGPGAGPAGHGARRVARSADLRER